MARLFPGARLDANFDAFARKGPDTVGNEGDATLARNLLSEDGNDQR